MRHQAFILTPFGSLGILYLAPIRLHLGIFGIKKVKKIVPKLHYFSLAGLAHLARSGFNCET